MRVKIKCPHCHKSMYSNITGKLIILDEGPKLTSLTAADTCTDAEMIETISKFIEVNGMEAIKTRGVETVFTDCLGISPNIPELVAIFLAAE